MHGRPVSESPRVLPPVAARRWHARDMDELTLLGPAGDGEHLTLVDAAGQRYRLAVNGALRSAVRESRPAGGPDDAPTMSPKDIQASLRAGATVEEVSESTGVDDERIRRYLGPVLAEREWVVQQAQGLRVGRDHEAPQLGDLALDRLATRGADIDELSWSATRRAGRPWEVTVRFVAGGKERAATWSVELSSRTLEAIDDEARWLSETDLSAPARPSRFSPAPLSPLTPMTTASPGLAAGNAEIPAGQDPQEDEADGGTEALLDDLAAHRGSRQDLQPELELEDEDAPLWGAHPPASQPELARDAHVLTLPKRRKEPAAPEQAQPDSETSPSQPEESLRAEEPTSQDSDDDSKPPERRARRRDRRSVPSWDEIVFGARPD